MFPQASASGLATGAIAFYDNCSTIGSFPAIDKDHSEILMEFQQLPKAKKSQTLGYWIRKHLPAVILTEWSIGGPNPDLPLSARTRI
jgi:hypothetical protein